MPTTTKLVKTPVIAFAGKAHSGKSAAGSIIAREYPVKEVAFADIMKHFVHRCCQVPASILWGPSEAKDQRLRQLLQRLGTDTFRGYDPETWVNVLIRRLENWELYGFDPDSNPKTLDMPPKAVNAIVVTDLRFKSELEGLRQYTKAYIVKITRDIQNPNMALEELQHPSEAELDTIPDSAFDAVISNTATLEDFAAEIIPRISKFLKACKG